MTTEKSILDDYWNLEQLAHELKVAPITIKRWRMARKGPPAIIHGGRLLFRKDAVRKWLLSREERQTERRSPLRLELSRESIQSARDGQVVDEEMRQQCELALRG